MVGRCAVPLFYAISGYLFFLHTDEGMPAIFKKMRKRVKTLLVPFVIAALFFPAFLLCMELLPFAKGFTNSADAFSNNLQLPLGEILMSLFYAKEGGTSPWAFHLWFLRDLIIIVALSPLLHIIKKANGGGYYVIDTVYRDILSNKILSCLCIVLVYSGRYVFDTAKETQVGRISYCFCTACSNGTGIA